EEGPHQSTANGDQESADEQVGRHHENDSGLAHSPKVDDRDDQQNSEADHNGVGKQRGDRGNQGSNARGDAHGRRQNVIREQGSSRQQARKRPKIVARHGVRTAARRIGSNGLLVRKINNDQQGDDGSTDGNDVLHAKNAERNKQAERRFRSVRRGTEPVQPKNGNALRWPDLFGTFVGGLDGLANESVEDIHRRRGPF